MCTILIRVEQLELQLNAAGVIVVQAAKNNTKKQQHTNRTHQSNVHE